MMENKMVERIKSAKRKRDNGEKVNYLKIRNELLCEKNKFLNIFIGQKEYQDLALAMDTMFINVMDNF